MFAGLVSLALAACGGGGGGGTADLAPASAGTAVNTTVSTTFSTTFSTPPAAAAVAALASTPAPPPAVAAGGSTPATPLPSTPPAAAAPASTAPPAATGSARDTLSFTFSLSSPRTTSAGVFAADGSLVRTLWRGQRLASGSSTRQWDQRLDDGSPAAPGAYTVRLIHHDINYRWEGVVGNTSAGNTSANGSEMPHRAFLPPASLAIDGQQLHFGVGYNEAQTAIQGFDLRQPQRPLSGVTLTDPFIGVGLLASDGVRLYWTNTGGISKAGFVAAFELAGGGQASFDEGQPLCLNRRPDNTCYADQNYRSVFGLRAAGLALPTGLAVQKSGNLLAVAYGGENIVRLFDKTRGRLLAEIAVPLSPHSANQLAMSAAGDLWVVSSTSVLRYTGLATQPRLALAISGLDKPLAVAPDPADDDVLWVADGGASQQLRQFGRNGLAGQVIGRRGGLSSDARVGADSLCFLSEAGREHTALAVDGQHQLWLVDTCNNRVLHFDAAGQPLGEMAYLPHSYVATVDGGRPNRVFANFLEFEIDYTRELSAPGAWRLVRNWLAVLPAALRDSNSMNFGFGGFPTVHTLANGRSYAMLPVAGRQVFVELTAAGTVREITTLRPASANQTSFVLYENGELGWAADEGGRQFVYRLRLDGFDAAGNPRWAERPTLLASAPRSASAPYHRLGTFTGMSAPRFPLTASAKVVFFNGGVDGPDAYHLGAVAQGGNQWAWQASPSGPLDGHGAFQSRSADRTIQYGGNVALAEGRSILYGYHGEFYTDLGTGRVGQANQFMHFFDNGLFVGQFGVPSTRGGPAVVPGRSGNAFSPALVRAAGRTYLYHNDESTWGGVHRWQLQGIDDIVEISAAGELGSAISLR